MAAGDLCIQTRNLGKTYGRRLFRSGFRALDSVSLEVGRGTVFGLLGPNGAGKTTFIKILLGLVRGTEGEARLLGDPVPRPHTRRRVGYLPEAHTDFLLAVTAEELGFAGVALVVALFAWIVVRAFAIARQSTLHGRHFAALAAQGIGVWIGFQALINMGVNMGLLPTKGLTLPLMSYGGSGLLANFVALAILLRIDWENRQLARGLNA